MEKQLMDKIRNHTADDIDREMIIARLKKDSQRAQSLY